MGPYAAQRILLHDVRGIVDSAFDMSCDIGVNDDSSDDVDDVGPASTWPLIELIGSRHDLLHTRIFNS